MKFSFHTIIRVVILLMIIPSCKEKGSTPSTELVSKLNLKKGGIISCGPANLQFGSVFFNVTGNKEVKDDFAIALELLHSFEYDEAEKVFAKVIDKDPQCAMAYWGIAMSNYHPLWEPPSVEDLKKGALAVAIAKSLPSKSKLETGFIDALGAYYDDWEKTNAPERNLHFEKAMAKLYAGYPNENETAIFYALALDAAADPKDKTYARQKKAGSILEPLYAKDPDHPGIIHYIIHTYDYPGLATLALTAARNYALVAPSSAHAQHMPSHIFTRLGLWDDAIKSNQQSVESAKCYAKATGIKGHWDEEFHGLDYLVYAWLQKEDTLPAIETMRYVDSIKNVYPVNFKVAYAFAAIPARLALERKNWADAASLKLHEEFPWEKFPWQESIIHFARLLGMVHTHNLPGALNELAIMQVLHKGLEQHKEVYKAQQVMVQIKAGEGWINFAKGDKETGLSLMKAAAEMEDSTGKHPVTPGEILPARELYADMLVENKDYENALNAYKAVLKNSPGRLKSLKGAGMAAEKTGRRNEVAMIKK